MHRVIQKVGCRELWAALLLLPVTSCVFLKEPNTLRAPVHTWKDVLALNNLITEAFH